MSASSHLTEHLGRTAVRRLAPLALAAALAPLAMADELPSLELLSAYSLPGGARFEGTCVGGLSALFYDRPNDRYFALSDSRRDARFYTLRITIGATGEEGRPGILGVDVESVVRLATREGLPYPDDRVDPEGFALFDSGSAFVSSEGVAADGVPPFVDRVNVTTGTWLGTLPLPAAYRPEHRDGAQLQGVRNNLGLESLTLAPGRRWLYAATESALAQDAADVEAGEEHFARVLRFELEPEPRLAGELLYPLVMPAGDVVVHGLVELLALDDAGRLLALERTFARDLGMRVKLFELRLDRADDAAGRTLPVLAKREVLDFATLPILLDNLEGLTFGPPLADGGETLLAVGDNDNTECAPPTSLAGMRPTQFLLFRLRR